MNRRLFLTTSGSLLIGITGGLFWRADSQGVFDAGAGPAYEPWKALADGGPFGLVSHAILAASPHNTQPWIFRISTGRIDLFADTTRAIGTIDPFLREMHMGLGCALENLLLAAAARGYRCTVALMPEPAEPRHVARVDLTSTQPVISARFRAIPQRHTNRGPYDGNRKISTELLSGLSRAAAEEGGALLAWFDDEHRMARLRALILQSTQAIIDDEEQSRDSFRWFRHDWHEIQKRADGLTIDATVSRPAMRALAKLMPPMSQRRIDEFWLRATRDDQLPTAAAFGALLVADPDDRRVQVRCGKQWQRLHLEATVHGLVAQPLNQIPERCGREQKLGLNPSTRMAFTQISGLPRLQPILLFRIGHPTLAALPSPRRGVQTVVDS